MEKTPTFLQRILDALEMKPWQLAQAIGVPHREIKAMLAPRHALAEMDRDDTWWLIAAYVDKRLALTLAIKADLNAALQRDRVKRAAQLQRWQRVPQDPLSSRIKRSSS